MVFSLRQTTDKDGTDRTRGVVLQPDGVSSTVASILGEWETLVFGFPALSVESVRYDELEYLIPEDET